MNLLLCSHCRKRVPYHIQTRKAKAIINNIEFEYTESYGICNECQQEIYVPGLEDQNEEIVEKQYENLIQKGEK